MLPAISVILLLGFTYPAKFPLAKYISKEGLLGRGVWSDVFPYISPDVLRVGDVYLHRKAPLDADKSNVFDLFGRAIGISHPSVYRVICHRDVAG